MLVLPHQKARQRILFLTSQLPLPLNTGGHIRSWHVLRGLARRFQVQLVTATSQITDYYPLLQEIGVSPTTIAPPNRTWYTEGIRVLRAFRARQPYAFYRRHMYRGMTRAIKNAVAAFQPDWIHLDHLDPFAYHSLFPNVPYSLDLHNSYSTIARRLAQQSRGIRSWYLHREAGLLRKAEEGAVSAARRVFAVSNDEAMEFRRYSNAEVELIPNGVDTKLYSALPTGRQGLPPCILFLGAFSWQPNADAAEFLVTKVLPWLQSNGMPDVKLLLVGRNPGASITAFRNQPGVELHADVPDVIPYLSRASLAVVPLDSGGGTRLKILEAFAAGLPVISTPIGCEGIEARDGEHLRIVERPKFANVVREHLLDPERSRRLALKARELVQEKYEWDAIVSKLVGAVEEELVNCKAQRTAFI